MTGRHADDWEMVHTVNDYFDGPRAGVADLGGIPHAYKCEWNREADDWSEVFKLSPIDAAQLRVIEEDWQIWRRWKAAYDTGLAQSDDHPALAVDRSRYEELREQVVATLRVDDDNAVRAMPEFRGTIEPPALQVRWSLVNKV